ncbi:MAG: glutamate ligase domain-containing protein, partial [Actinomycetota bacterium]
EWLDGPVNPAPGVGAPGPRPRGAPTLERIGTLLTYLGTPQDEWPMVHVTGTNGKTSVARMTAEILQVSGLRVGTFTSPHPEVPAPQPQRVGGPIDERGQERRIGLPEHQRCAPDDDPGLLRRDMGPGGPEPLGVVEADVGHHRHPTLDRARGIPTPAEPHLHDGDVDGGIGEPAVRGGDHDLEVRRIDAGRLLDEGDRVEHLVEIVGGDGITVDRDPLVLLDGAHNPDGITVLAAALAEELGADVPTTYVLGFSRERDPGEMLDRLGVRPETDLLVCTRAPHARALAPALIAAAAVDRGFAADRIEIADGVADAIGTALLATPTAGRIVVTGSLYLVGAARSVFVRS